MKLAYLDPPYNTGRNFDHYTDNQKHDAWLSFMGERIRAVRALLSDDGLVFIQIDDKEQAYLKVLMDSVFGRENFVNVIVVPMSNMAGRRVQLATSGRKFPKIKETWC